jgi:hypothetical protein
MPYLPTSRRKAELRGLKLKDAGHHCETSGELNFCLTELLSGFAVGHGKRYETLDQLGGASIYALFEFYRRVVAPYEDEKVEQNGDVYPAALLPSRDALRATIREVMQEMVSEEGAQG